MIETKIEQLRQAVEWFYGAEFKLDEAMAKYQTAVKLAKEIEQDLDEMKNKIEILGSEDVEKASAGVEKSRRQGRK
jgi:exodeoxyribonuclease VII small subunit